MVVRGALAGTVPACVRVCARVSAVERGRGGLVLDGCLGIKSRPGSGEVTSWGRRSGAKRGG